MLKANFFIFSFNEVTRLKPSAFFKHLRVTVWNTVQYLWSASPYSRRYSQFSSQIFDLRRQCWMEASCSWSRSTLHLFIMLLFVGSCLSILSLTVADTKWPIGFKETLKFCKQSVMHGNQRLWLHLSTNLFMNAPFVLDVMDYVVIRVF